MNWIKRLFCKHEQLKEIEIITYHKPNRYEVRGHYFKGMGLKCNKCGKLFV